MGMASMTGNVLFQSPGTSVKGLASAASTDGIASGVAAVAVDWDRLEKTLADAALL